MVSRDELERDAVDVGVLGFEVAVVVKRVGTASQSTADDLLAQQLAAERADAEDVGDSVGVPTFGEHRDANYAAHSLAELALLADGVHDLAKQVFVSQVVDVGAGSAAAQVLLERLDLAGGRIPEVLGQR